MPEAMKLLRKTEKETKSKDGENVSKLKINQFIVIYLIINS